MPGGREWEHKLQGQTPCSTEQAAGPRGEHRAQMVEQRVQAQEEAFPTLLPRCSLLQHFPKRPKHSPIYIRIFVYKNIHSCVQSVWSSMPGPVLGARIHSEQGRRELGLHIGDSPLR